MRFMLMFEAGDAAGHDCTGDPDAVAALERYGTRLLDAGVLLETARLHPPSLGATVWLSDARGARVDAAPARCEGVIEYCWLIEVSSLEEAIEWARRCAGPFGNARRRIAIRPLVEAGDARDAWPTRT